MAEPVLAKARDIAWGPIGRKGLGQWGVATLIASEAALFAYLLFAYYYTGASALPGWLLEPRPKLFPSLPNTVLLVASSFAAMYGEKKVEAGDRKGGLLGLGGAFIMGTGFALVQLHEWSTKHYGIGTSSYGSLYFVTTGFHMAHVIVGLAILAALLLWTALGDFSPRRRIGLSAGVLYWHFVDIVWLFVFTTYYLTPYLGFAR
ncbi:MAG: cytochrome c oxidase subunit 3 [Sphingomonadaceae bacterium]